jgi:hypothetical protein
MPESRTIKALSKVTHFQNCLNTSFLPHPLCSFHDGKKIMEEKTFQDSSHAGLFSFGKFSDSWKFTTIKHTALMGAFYAGSVQYGGRHPHVAVQHVKLWPARICSLFNVRDHLNINENFCVTLIFF